MPKKRNVKRTAFPSYDKLIEALEEVAAEADEDEDRVAIAGGFAMQIWGSPRLTADIDIISNIILTRFGREPLAFGGIRGFTTNKVPVDIIVRSDNWIDLYEAALEDAEEVDDVPMPVVSPEYLIAIKMVAGREKDEEDIRYLVLWDELDMSRTEEIVAEHLGPYAVGELRALVQEAEWKRSKR